MRFLFAGVLMLTFMAQSVLALEIEEVGRVATVPPAGPHWVWVPDRLFQHSVLFNGDSGEVMGMVDSRATLTPRPPTFSKARNELYSVDVDYARGLRGKRTDYVTIYDATSLNVTGEILLEKRTAESNTSLGHVAMLDGEKLLLVFSQFPTPTATIVNLEERRVVEEVVVAGCAGLYPVDAYRFASLCGSGGVLLTTLSEDGTLAKSEQTPPFFDSVEDPVFISAGRRGANWVFVSFKGLVHEVDFSTNPPAVEEPWALAGVQEVREGWRPGGLQHVAVHEPTDELFVVMHQGGSGTHKDAGASIWRYDLNEKSRLGELEVPNLTAEFLGPLLGISQDSWADRLLHWVIPNEGVHSITVSQDDNPLLFLRNGGLGVVGIVDLKTGAHIRTLEEAGLAGPTLGVY